MGIARKNRPLIRVRMGMAAIPRGQTTVSPRFPDHKLSGWRKTARPLRRNPRPDRSSVTQHVGRFQEEHTIWCVNSFVMHPKFSGNACDFP